MLAVAVVLECWSGSQLLSKNKDNQIIDCVRVLAYSLGAPEAKARLVSSA